MALGLNIDKKKMENFWYYYKIHVFVGIFIVIMLVVTLKDCANNVMPDVSVAYIGANYIPEEVSQKFKDGIAASGIVQDVNQDNQQELLFQSMIVSEDVKTQQDIAMQQKVMLVFFSGDTQLFLLDRENFEKFGIQGAFDPLDDWADKFGITAEKNPEIKLTVEETTDTHIYAIPLKGNGFLEKSGFKTENMYIAIRVQGEKDQEDSEKMAMYQNAYAILEELLKYNEN